MTVHLPLRGQLRCYFLNVEVFQTGKLEWNDLLLTGAEEEEKMAEIVRNIFFFANNSIFKSIVS